MNDNMNSISIPIHSFLDLITNSSSETYVTSDRQTVTSIKSIIDAVLKAGGSTKTCDDMFMVKLAKEDGGYGRYDVVIANPKGPEYAEAASALSKISGAFRAETIGNG